ncbi:hypothetical protein V8E51_019195 [Hyaloscypha variabilis]
MQQKIRQKMQLRVSSHPLIHHQETYLQPPSVTTLGTSLSFLCPTCQSRHGTKRDLERHINSIHVPARKFYCSVSTCKRSLVGGGKYFLREDNRRHLRGRIRSEMSRRREFRGKRKL